MAPYDVEGIVAINAEIFGPLYPWMPYTTEVYRERLEKHTNPLIRGMRIKGKLIGSIVGYQREKYAYLWILGILPEHRGRGIGRKALQEFETFALSKGLKEVRVKTFNMHKEMLVMLIKSGYQMFFLAPNTKGHENDPRFMEIGLFKKL